MKEYEVIKPLLAPIYHVKFFSIISSLCFITSFILFLLKNEDANFLSVLGLFSICGLLLALWKMEWWKINEHEMIVRNVFIILRKCSMNDIMTIKITLVSYARDFDKECYIINDLRNKVKKYGLAYNARKNIFIIPVNDISSKYLAHTLKR